MNEYFPGNINRLTGFGGSVNHVHFIASARQSAHSAIVNDQTSENDAREQRVCHRIFGTLISNWMVAR